MTVGKTEEAYEYDRELCDGLMGKAEKWRREKEMGSLKLMDMSCANGSCNRAKTRVGNEKNKISHSGEVEKKG